MKKFFKFWVKIYQNRILRVYLPRFLALAIIFILIFAIPQKSTKVKQYKNDDDSLELPSGEYLYLGSGSNTPVASQGGCRDDYSNWLGHPARLGIAQALPAGKLTGDNQVKVERDKVLQKKCANAETINKADIFVSEADLPDGSSVHYLTSSNPPPPESGYGTSSAGLLIHRKNIILDGNVFIGDRVVLIADENLIIRGKVNGNGQNGSNPTSDIGGFGGIGPARGGSHTTEGNPDKIDLDNACETCDYSIRCVGDLGGLSAKVMLEAGWASQDVITNFFNNKGGNGGNGSVARVGSPTYPDPETDRKGSPGQIAGGGGGGEGDHGKKQDNTFEGASAGGGGGYGLALIGGNIDFSQATTIEFKGGNGGQSWANNAPHKTFTGGIGGGGGGGVFVAYGRLGCVASGCPQDIPGMINFLKTKVAVDGGQGGSYTGANLSGANGNSGNKYIADTKPYIRKTDVTLPGGAPDYSWYNSPTTKPINNIGDIPHYWINYR